MSEDLGCGVVTVNFDYLADGDVEATPVTVSGQAKWCEGSSKYEEPTKEDFSSRPRGRYFCWRGEICPSGKECDMSHWKPEYQDTARWGLCSCSSDGECASGEKCVGSAPYTDNAMIWSSATFCVKEIAKSYAEALGYMNYDGTLRNTGAESVDYASFRTGGGYGMMDFANDLQKAIDSWLVNIQQKHLFSYGSTYSAFESDYEKSAYSFEYRDYYQGELSGNADMKWLYDKCGGEPVGYLDIGQGAGAEGKAIKFGVCHSNEGYREDSSLLGGLRQKLAQDIVGYWTEGKDTILTGSFSGGNMRIGVITNTHAVWPVDASGTPTAVLQGPIYADPSTGTVVLDASGSSDPDGKIKQYVWESRKSYVIEAEEYLSEGSFAIYIEPNKMGIKRTSGIVNPSTATYALKIATGDSGRYKLVAPTGVDVYVDQNKFINGQEISLSSGDYSIKLTTTSSTKIDKVEFKRVGDVTPHTTTDPVYNMPITGGQYSVTLKVRDNNEIESSPVTVTVYANAKGADIQMVGATRGQDTVENVDVQVQNKGSGSGTAVVSVWTTANRPDQYSCEQILNGGISTFKNAEPTGVLDAQGTATISVQSVGTDPYTVAVVSGSGARSTTCDMSITSGDIDYADMGRGASSPGNNALVDQLSTLTSQYAVQCESGCSFEVDLGAAIPGIQEIDTWLYDKDCEYFAGYQIDVFDGVTWKQVAKKTGASGKQQDVFSPQTVQKIKYTFNAPGIKHSSDSSVEGWAIVLEVGAYQEPQGASTGTCDDYCHDDDGDGWGTSLSGWGCTGGEPDPNDQDPCNPDQYSAACEAKKK